MSPVLLIVILALGWVAITGGFSLGNLALGAIVAALVILLFRHRLARPLSARRLLAIFSLAGTFVLELLLSALSVARLAVAPRLRTRLAPAIIAFPLSAKSDAEITLFASLITLTPGTLALDVSADRQRLYVHVLTLKDKDALIRSLAEGLERKVIEVFR
jgi:multicomponent Na+:H+ antiporter subunit E